VHAARGVRVKARRLSEQERRMPRDGEREREEVVEEEKE